MKEFTYQIKDPSGMPARPAGQLASFAKKFESSIRIQCKEKEADAKRLLSLMSLGATHGTVLTFLIEGEDEERAAAALSAFCENGFCAAWENT